MILKLKSNSKLKVTPLKLKRENPRTPSGPLEFSQRVPNWLQRHPAKKTVHTPRNWCTIHLRFCSYFRDRNRKWERLQIWSEWSHNHSIFLSTATQFSHQILNNTVNYDYGYDENINFSSNLYWIFFFFIYMSNTWHYCNIVTLSFSMIFNLSFDGVFYILSFDGMFFTLSFDVHGLSVP